VRTSKSLTIIQITFCNGKNIFMPGPRTGCNRYDTGLYKVSYICIYKVVLCV